MSSTSPSAPLFFGQARYCFELVENPGIRYRNPGFRDSLRCNRRFAFWLIIEDRAVHDLHGRLIWHSHTVGRYHRSSVSRRKIKGWVDKLNRRPIDDFFYKETHMSSHVIIYHKRRLLHQAPMRTRRLGSVVEDRMVDYKLLLSPVDDQDLLAGERKLEKAIQSHNQSRREDYQRDYYLSLRGQVFGDEARLLQSKLAGDGVVVEAPRIKVADKSWRLSRSLRSIGGYEARAE